jgi:predicted TIM-barrel fold metal-dependent hydrolase
MWGGVISPAPVLFGYDRTDEVSVATCEATNQGMAEFCDYTPDRYHWLANLPMQDPGAAAAMYAEAVQAGAVGAAIGTSVAVIGPQRI